MKISPEPEWICATASCTLAASVSCARERRVRLPWGQVFLRLRPAGRLRTVVLSAALRRDCCGLPVAESEPRVQSRVGLTRRTHRFPTEARSPVAGRGPVDVGSRRVLPEFPLLRAAAPLRPGNGGQTVGVRDCELAANPAAALAAPATPAAIVA